MRRPLLPPRTTPVTVAIVLALAGVQLVAAGVSHGGPPPVPTDRAGDPVGGVVAAPSTPYAIKPLTLSRSVPVRLDIPRIGVHTGLIRLGLRPDGTPAAPPLGPRSPAGWYQGLASPGENGPAILIGHVDSRDGPAVFFRLSELRPGDSVTVLRADRVVVSFTVVAIERYPKAAFPSRQVYGHVDRPALRMVTCGGRFNRRTGHYLDSIVVYAEQTPAPNPR